MKISVCLCSYNGEKYIKEQLESIINQSVKVDEIIICDDGSQDNTISIAKEVLSTSDILSKVVVNQINLGVTKNFEKALELSSGDIIFLSDQDDLWEYDKVMEHIEIYNNNQNINLVFSNAEVFNENGVMSATLWEQFNFAGKKKKVFNQSQLRSILMGWFVTGATLSVKKQFVIDQLPFNNCLLHDQILSFAAATTDSMYAISSSLTKYRKHKEQLVGTQNFTTTQALKCRVDFKKEVDMYMMLKQNVQNVGNRKLIENKIKWLNNRSKIVNSSSIFRLFRASIFLVSGNYSKFSNSAIKTYGKDLLNRS